MPTFPAAAPDDAELPDGVLPPDPGERGAKGAGVPAADPAASPPAETSDYEALRKELSAAVVIPDRTWDVDTRPGYAARFRVDLTDTEFQRLRKQCRVKNGKRNPQTGEYEVDELKLSRLVLGVYSTALLRDGVVIEEEGTGDPMTFRSPEFLAIYDAKSVGDAVAAFYGTDGGVISHGRALIQASGWLDDPDETETTPGPTERSSTD